MEVGNKIRAYLIQRGISQTWVSLETAIPLPKLNLALTGKRRMKFEEYELICGALGVGVDKFLEARKPKNKEDEQAAAKEVV